MSNITRGDFRRGASKRRKKRTGTVLLCIIAICFIIFMSPLFKIKNINVTGITELDKTYVINASSVKEGVHLAKLNFDEIELSLSKTAYISGAEVKFSFPSTLNIAVEEKMPVVYYGFADGFVGINEDGVVTDIIQTMEKKLPAAKGIILSSYSIGETPHISGTKVSQIECLTAVAGELYKLSMSSDISEIDVSQTSNITLKTQNGLIVKCGDTTELSYKFSLLKEVIAQADCSGIVDISTPGQATYEME